MEEATSGKVEIKVNKQEEIKVEKGGNPDRKRQKLRQKEVETKVEQGGNQVRRKGWELRQKEVETTKEVVKNQGRTGFNQGIKGWKARQISVVERGGN